MASVAAKAPAPSASASASADDEGGYGDGDVVADILRSTAWVMSDTAQPHGGNTRNVWIDEKALAAELERHAKQYTTAAPNLPPSWGSLPFHYADPVAQPERTAQYVMVLDALNFCFWPLAGYEYEHLGGGLKRALAADPKCFDADRLAALTPETLSGWLQPSAPLKPNNPAAQATATAAASGAMDYKQQSANGAVVIPLLAERVRALREVGRGLTKHFGGLALNLIKAAGGSAVRLVELVSAHFPAFRDHAVYRGKQVFLYKRAQIFVGDVFGAFNGADAMKLGASTAAAAALPSAASAHTLPVGAFHDIDRLTCFADYRVPQVLRACGILQYSKALAAHIDSLTELSAGSEMEIELRAATIQAVHKMQQYLKAKGQPIMSIQLDWVLWERGEAQLATLSPHHRVLTIFY